MPHDSWPEPTVEEMARDLPPPALAVQHGIDVFEMVLVGGEFSVPSPVQPVGDQNPEREAAQPHLGELFIER